MCRLVAAAPGACFRTKTGTLELLQGWRPAIGSHSLYKRSSPLWRAYPMPRDLLDAMRTDPGHRTLGELLQERQWAVNEISRLRDEVIRIASRRVDPVQSASSQRISAARDFGNPLISRRLLRLSDVESLVGLSRSMIYRLISERRFPAQTRVGLRAVRWRAADILAWQDQVMG